MQFSYISMILLIIFFILTLRYLNRRRIASRAKYQQHIDSLAEDLFPQSISSTTDTTDTTSVPDTPESDTQYQEAKHKMVADIRTYFNQRKINAAIADVQASDNFVQIDLQDRQTFPPSRG